MNKKNINENKDVKYNKENMNGKYSNRKEVLTSFFSDKSYTPVTKKQISAILNVSEDSQIELDSILKELEEDGYIFIDDSKRYLLSESANVVKCIYHTKSKGYGFGILEADDDIYIPFSSSLDAMNLDEILVQIVKGSGSKRSKEGRVIRVLKRNTKKIIGKYIKNNNFGFVEPIDKAIQDIYISKANSKNLKDGQVVEVEITKYAQSNSKAEGKIISVIGDFDTPNIEAKALYKEYGLEEMQSFSPRVLEEVLTINQEVTLKDKKNRKDKTEENIYTIDSEEAKDLDDAICVKKLNDDTYILSVYIADVSHYVKDNTQLDAEAVKRSTSIYIPSTVVPMLPKELSNGICSLNAGVERLALSIDMTINKDGEVTNNEIYKSVIKVKKKMTYEKVYKVIQNTDEKVLEEYKEYVQDISLMKELALVLNANRIKQGSINFDIPDTKVVLDDLGNVTGIEPYETNIANKIIEEFMLVANRTVAEKFFYLEMPFIYRIHEVPDVDRLIELNELLRGYKKKIKAVKNIHPKTLADIIASIDDDEEKQIVSTFMLRTLKMARYSNECVGHFGLAAKFYCHFTSPIRRYPDLFIHRVISDFVENNGNIPSKRIEKYVEQSLKYAKMSSEMEKQATIIERDFDDLYKAMYMKQYINDKFEGVISSITSFGMFVKLTNTVEGLVSFDNIPGDDYYVYDEVKRILVGRRKGKVYRIGDKVEVILEKVDTRAKEIDFKLLK